MSEQITRLNTALTGRYAIERELGEGGMATVYLADDLKHNRKVALKVLKPELAAVVGSERFLAEIETTANLQHPHILPLFDSGDADGFLYYVMPFIEGETLRDRIDREKQLPVDEAVGIATAVASALSVAHEQGVIHRDIKPSNILLSRGEPLVSDFGIAIAVTNSSGARLTETGLSVGTPYYMSPEQATGDREITAASDVYALGCVLYEMLVGEPPYVGSTAQAVLGKILTEKPRNPTAVRAVVPKNVEGAVLQALEKLPADRFRTASGFVRAITNSGFRYGDALETEAAGAAAGGRWKGAALGLAAVSVLMFANTMRTSIAARNAEPPRAAVFELDMGELDVSTDLAISKQGHMFAVVAAPPGDGERQLWVRRADEADFRPVPGTEDAQWVDFSPDGDWLVFRHSGRQALLKVAIAGGGAIPILEVDSISPHDPHWGANGLIVFTGPQGTWWVSETGEGGAHLLSSSIDGVGPQLLPDGSGVLASDGDHVYVIDFETDSARVIINEGTLPKYLGTGHVAYMAASGGLFVVPFDLRRHEVTGPPTPIRDGVAAGGFQPGYDVSLNGTFVFREGEPVGGTGGAPERRMLFVDREGRPDTVRLTPRPIGDLRISPDGRYVAYGTFVGGDDDDEQIQVLDLLTGSSPEVTSGGDHFAPVWSPDGSRLAIASRREGANGTDVYVMPADGSAPPEHVLDRSSFQMPLDWSDDDEIVIQDNAAGNLDLGIVPLADDAEPRPYLQADYTERRLRISPDGALAAYMSTETDALEVYVRGFPEPVGKWRISVGGGRYPLWSPDGDELYFWRQTSGVDSLFAVPLQREPDFVPGEPVFLFAGDYVPWESDVHPDGRFLVAQNIGAAPVEAGGDVTESRYLVVLNWFEELRARLGGGR